MTRPDQPDDEPTDRPWYANCVLKIQIAIGLTSLLAVMWVLIETPHEFGIFLVLAIILFSTVFGTLAAVMHLMQPSMTLTGRLGVCVGTLVLGMIVFVVVVSVDSRWSEAKISSGVLQGLFLILSGCEFVRAMLSTEQELSPDDVCATDNLVPPIIDCMFNDNEKDLEDVIGVIQLKRAWAKSNEALFLVGSEGELVNIANTPSGDPIAFPNSAYDGESDDNKVEVL